MEDKAAVLAAAQEQAQAEDTIHGRQPREFLNSMLSCLDQQQSHTHTSFDKNRGEISGLSKVVALLATSVGRPENPSSSARMEHVSSQQPFKNPPPTRTYVSSCPSLLTAASHESTGWQPDYQHGSTPDSHALHVFDGMPTPSYEMDSGIPRVLQGNQSNSHAYTSQYHHMVDTRSCSQYETSALTWTYCPTLQGRVLSVVMHQVNHPVPTDVLNHLFSVYGVVEMIFQSMNQHGRKLLIQYQYSYMADNALRATNGWYLYRTYCQLYIRHADPTELQILDDYSCALFSEINNEADHLSNAAAAMPQDKVSDCCQLVTPHMKGHTSERQVQSNIPVFDVATNGTHEQKQRDGKHDTSTMPNERVIEQPTPMQVLDELPSVCAPKVAVQLCSSEVVQAATMVRQGKPTSSAPLVMHVDDLQLPMSVQDASDLFEEMPVYDVYEEDTNASLNFVVELSDTVGQHKQYDGEKPLYDHEEPHGAAKLSSEEDVCSNEFAQVFTDTPGQQPYEEEQHDTLEKQQQVKEKASVNVQQLRAPPLNVLPLNERRKEWDPGVPVLPHSYTAPHPIVTHPGDFTRRLQPIFASPVWSSIYLWLQVLTERIATENSLSWLPIPELATGQSRVTCASYVWDPGTMLPRYKSKWWFLLTEEKVMLGLIPEQWSFWCNAIHYCQIFQRCTTVSSPFDYQGIALWLITFNPP